MNNQKLDTLIQDTCARIRTAVGKQGLIRKIFLLDTQQWYDQYKPDDFGDHVPFVSVAEGNTELAKSQWHGWQQRMLNGIPVPRHRLPLPPMLYAHATDDLLQGMSVLYDWFGDPYWIEHGQTLAMNVQRAFQQRSGAFAALSVPFVHWHLPEGLSPLRPSMRRHVANATTNGLLASSFLQFGAWNKQQTLTEAGVRCLSCWTSTKTFQERHLFPDTLAPETGLHLMKSNSNFGHAMLDAIEHGHVKFKPLLTQQLHALAAFRKGKGCANTIDGEPSLMATQAYCTLLWRARGLDAAYGREAAQIAWDVADATFGERPDPAWRATAIEDDAVGDYANMLMLLDTKRKHQELVARAHDYLVKHFYVGDGLWQDYCKSGMQRTAHSKFLGGVLKHLIGYRAYLDAPLNERWARLLEDR